MKQLSLSRGILFVLLVSALLSSCSNGLRLERRHYRNGFYIDRNERSSVSTEIITEDIQEPANETQSLLQNVDADTVVKDSAITIEENEIAVDSNKFTPCWKWQTPSDTSDKKSKFIDRFRYKGPPEAKKSANIHRLGLTFIVISIASIFLSLTPLYFLAYGSFLVLPGIVLEIVAMVMASEGVGKYSTTDPATSEYFRRIRRRAIWGLVALGITYLVLIVIAVVIALFFNGY